MKINVTHPEILRIKYRPELNDKCYPACLWANFDMDMETDTLTITGDCGTFSYGYWDVGPRGFLKFLAGLDEDYLLGKLAERSEFDLEATVEGMKETLEESHEFNTRKINTLIQDLRDKLKYRGENGQSEFGALEEWNDEHDIGMCDLFEAVYYDYPTYAKRIVGIFVEYIQPKIREIVKAGEQLENQQG